MKKFKLFSLILILFSFSSNYRAALITSTNSGGNWNSTTTWNGGVIPTINDDVTIAAGVSVTVTANASCNSLTLEDGNNSNTANSILTLTINSGVTLTVTTDIITHSDRVNLIIANITGAGTLNCNNFYCGALEPNGYGISLSNETNTINLSIANLNVSSDIFVVSHSLTYGSKFINTTLNINSGTVSAKSIQTVYGVGSTGALNISTIFASVSSYLKLSGNPVLVLMANGTNDITLNSNTIEYNGEIQQSIIEMDYTNLVLSSPSTATAYKTFNGTYTTFGIANLTINPNVYARIATNQSIKVTGTLTNNGTLKLEHHATLFQPSSANPNLGTGTYLARQNVQGGGITAPNDRYYLIGTPLIDANISAFFATPTNRLWIWDEPSSAWVSVLNSSQNLINGYGYCFKASQPLDSIIVSGTGMNNGTFNRTLTRNTTGSYRGWALVENPYPSYISWTSLLASNSNLVNNNNINGTYYIRTRNTAGTNFNTLETFSNGIGTNNSGYGELTDNIPPFQAIWFRLYNVPTATFTFNNSVRTQATGIGLRSTPTQFPGFLRMSLIDGIQKDQFIAYMSPEFSMEMDKYDAEKMMGTGNAQLYTTLNSTKLVINSYRNLKGKISIPLTMEMPTSKVYTLLAEEFHVEDGIILLEDKLEDVIQDLTINPEYTFFSNAGVNSGRFVVHFLSATAPILIDSPQQLNLLSTEEITAENILITNNSQGKIIVNISESYDPAGIVKLYDANGRLIDQKQIIEHTTSFDMYEQPGIYFVEVTTGLIQIKKKIVL